MALGGEVKQRIKKRPVKSFLKRRVRSEQVQNEKSPNFRVFDPNFAPKSAPNFPRIFRGPLVLCFVGNRDHNKKITKNPRHFSMPNPQANSMKKYTRAFFWCARTTPISKKKRSENAWANEKIHVGSQKFQESLRELLPELWVSHCTSRETPFREWDFAFREFFLNSES